MSLVSFINSLTPSCHAVDGEATHKAWYTDKRDGRTIPPQAIAFPNSTQQVSQILAYCNSNCIPVIPQGGNTGLVGASIPQSPQSGLILRLNRMQALRHFDAASGLITVESGLTLARVRALANDRKMTFPLFIASEDLCTVGGNLSTNAGGMETHRYGNIRRSCLGVEFVCADGTIIDRSQPLLKNNAGYDLSQLVIGAEGTLGIITAATMRLYPLCEHVSGLAFWFRDLSHAVDAVAAFRTAEQPALQYAEVMHVNCFSSLDTSRYHPPEWPTGAEWVLLLVVENHNRKDGRHLEQYAKTMSLAINGTDNQGDTQPLWKIRSHLSALQAERGPALKFDLALPLDRLVSFIDRALESLAEHFPEHVPVPFGHLGDGNIHFDIIDLRKQTGITTPKGDTVNESMFNMVEDLTLSFGGTIAAEHGIGRHHRRLKRMRSPDDIALMKRLRSTFDPNGILNPGVLF